MQQESDWIDIEGKIPDLLDSQTLNITGNISDLNVQNSFTIPTAYLREILQEALTLTKSAYSP